jgi:hypothetical protein
MIGAPALLPMLGLGLPVTGLEADREAVARSESGTAVKTHWHGTPAKLFRSNSC